MPTKFKNHVTHLSPPYVDMDIIMETCALRLSFIRVLLNVKPNVIVIEKEDRVRGAPGI